MLIGYYSEREKWGLGSALYSRPDGTEVEVTTVRDPDLRYPDALAADAVEVGEVVRFVRRLTEPGEYPQTTPLLFWSTTSDAMISWPPGADYKPG